MKNACWREYTPLYKKGIKQNQEKPMETTPYKSLSFLEHNFSNGQILAFIIGPFIVLLLIWYFTTLQQFCDFSVV